MIGIVVLLLTNISSAQEYNISIAKPKVKATVNQHALSSIIEGALKETISNSKGFVSLINRTDFEEIEKRRNKIAKSNKDLNLAAASMIGANYILESKASNVKTITDSLSVKKNVSGKLIPKMVFSKHFSFDLDLSLVSVEDGSVSAQFRVSPTGLAYKSDTDATAINKEQLSHEAVLDCRDCLVSTLRYMILQALPVHLPVLHIHKSKKMEAKELIIKGGKDTPLRNGVKFNILKIYTQEIGGESILRQEKIGEAKLEEVLIGTTRCKVKNGGKDVYKAIEAGDKVVVVVTDLKEQKTCNYYLQSRDRKSKNAGLKSARTSDTLPSDEKSKKEEKTTKKKVVRKK